MNYNETNEQELALVIVKMCYRCKSNNTMPTTAIDKCDDNHCPLWSYRNGINEFDENDNPLEIAYNG